MHKYIDAFFPTGSSVLLLICRSLYNQHLFSSVLFAFSLSFWSYLMNRQTVLVLIQSDLFIDLVIRGGAGGAFWSLLRSGQCS